MKNKIIIFIIGLMLGSIISCVSIYIYTKANSSNNINNNFEMPNREMNNNGQMPSDIPNNNNMN